MKKKPKPKTLKQLKDKCWTLFSEYIRRKDADEGGTVECFTCRRLFFWREVHAGHFVAGRTNAVLFDERIVRPQCISCNIWKGGNYSAYTLRMLDEVGREKVEDYLALKGKTLKYTKSDILDLIELYKGKLREIGCD